MTDERLCGKCGHEEHLAENCAISWSGRQADGQDVTVWCECVEEAAPSTDEGEAQDGGMVFVPFSAGSTTSSAPVRYCQMCGRQEHGSVACKAIRAEDYPVLAAIWDNPEDEVAFDVSEEAKALIRAPLEDRGRMTLLAVEHDLKALAPHSDALEGWWYKERIEEIVLKLIALREHGESYTEHQPRPPRHAFAPDWKARAEAAEERIRELEAQLDGWMNAVGVHVARAKALENENEILAARFERQYIDKKGLAADCDSLSAENERLREALRLAASMLVAGAFAVDRNYPDDPNPTVQTDMRSFARWAFDGSEGHPPVSDDAHTHIDEFRLILDQWSATPPSSTEGTE